MCRNLVVGGILLVTSSPPSGENATRRISGRTCTSQCPRSEDGYLYASPMTPAKKQQEHSRDVLPFPSSLSLFLFHSLARSLSHFFTLLGEAFSELPRGLSTPRIERELELDRKSRSVRDTLRGRFLGFLRALF